MTEQTLKTIPDHHFSSLKDIENGYWWYEGRLIWAKNFIRRWLENNAFTDPIYYVDLGCGTGGFGTEIQNSFAMDKTLFVDYSQEALKHIPKNPNIQTLEADLTSPLNLPFSPNLVTCMDVIEHIEDDVKSLETIYSVLKPGGLLIVSTPAHSFLYSSWDKALGHYRRYSKQGLVDKLEKSGFSIIRASYGWSFLFPAAPYRFLTSQRQTKLEYPRVNAWINRLLIFLARLESRLSSWLPYPFGTSVFIAATKESK